MDPNSRAHHGTGDASWHSFTDADFMNLGASHSQPVPPHARSSHRDAFGREQQVTPRHMSSLEPGASTMNMDILTRIAYGPANAAHGVDSPNHAMLNALRMVMNGAISPQELERVLPEGIVRQVREASQQPEWPPHAHTTHHDAMSHAPLQQQQTAQPAVDPMMFWMPPPPHIPAPPHARGASGLEDLSYHQRSAPQSYRRRTSSERGDVPIPGPSTTRTRTRSLGRRSSISSSTAVVHGVPETPVEQEAEDPDEDPDVEEDKRRRNTAASARFRAKKKQQVVHLERAISDLSSRADELEREASDLRRENGWLKEIVMLKGRTFRGPSSGVSQEPPPGSGSV